MVRTNAYISSFISHHFHQVEGNIDQQCNTAPKYMEDLLVIFQLMHWHIGTFAGVVGLATAIEAVLAPSLSKVLLLEPFEVVTCQSV